MKHASAQAVGLGSVGEVPAGWRKPQPMGLAWDSASYKTYVL